MYRNAIKRIKILKNALKCAKIHEISQIFVFFVIFVAKIAKIRENPARFGMPMDRLDSGGFARRIVGNSGLFSTQTRLENPAHFSVFEAFFAPFRFGKN